MNPTPEQNQNKDGVNVATDSSQAERLVSWQNAQKMLPTFMKDFHDCKDLFKTIDAYARFKEEKEGDYPSWIQGHCYVVDKFLPFMAMHGYTLQRTRRKLLFCDLQESIKSYKDKIAEQFGRVLSS